MQVKDKPFRHSLWPQFFLTLFELDIILEQLVRCRVFRSLDTGHQDFVADSLLSLLQKINILKCESGGIGKRTGLRIQLLFRDWGFKSPLSHQLSCLRKEFDESKR